MKIAIPLLNEDLELKDIQDDSGFVEAYFEDINKPSLTNHIFLMYDAKSQGKNTAQCLYKLQKLKNRYGTRTIYIKNKPYIVYSFTINGTIRNLRDGNIILNPLQKQRVLDFWKFKDGWIMNNVLLGTMYEHPETSILPEEDYSPEFDENEEGEVLEQSTSPFILLC